MNTTFTQDCERLLRRMNMETKSSEPEKTCLTDGSPVTDDHQELKEDGQQKDYVVLCPEERAKGFIRPLRNRMTHVGITPKYPLRDLTEEEKADPGNIRHNFVKYEEYPESEHPRIGRMWSKKSLKKGCGVTTTIGSAIAETYARNPTFYGGTFCVGCGAHFPLAEFRWDDDTVVGT